MLSLPLMNNPCVLEYIKAQRDLFELTLTDNCEAHISYAFEIDYHNFMVLATQIGREFMNKSQHNAIRNDISVFMDILHEDILSPAIRKFHQQMINDKMQGELGELYVSCEQNDITLHDFLKYARQSIKFFESKLVFHGGKNTLKVFNEYVDKSAKEHSITIENDITPDKWTMFFYHENNRDKFFHADSTEYLFHSILTPIVRNFYNCFRD